MNTFIATGLFSGLAISTNKKTDAPATKDQLRTRPGIDDVICHNLDGNALKEALFVIDNIRENNMRIKWSSVNVWSVQYRRKHVCDLRIEKDTLSIGPVNDVLATRVRNMSYTHENIEQLIGALRNSISGVQEPSFAPSH